MSVIWHDLECGPYVEDLPLWRALAAEHGDPVLDVGAGTGRIAIDLARLGHHVTALDSDASLVAELLRRADGLDLDAVIADARSFELRRRFALCIVPMQTIQLLGGSEHRTAFLTCARRHLLKGGVLAAALTSQLEPYELADGLQGPLPDLREIDGVLYASQPTAVREDRDGFVLERRREIVTPSGRRSAQANEVRLDRLEPYELEREALAAGLSPAARETVPATADYVGSDVVILRA
jgi:SAM-dependent methyltransferase